MKLRLIAVVPVQMHPFELSSGGRWTVDDGFVFSCFLALVCMRDGDVSPPKIQLLQKAGEAPFLIFSRLAALKIYYNWESSG